MEGDHGTTAFTWREREKEEKDCLRTRYLKLPPTIAEGECNGAVEIINF